MACGCGCGGGSLSTQPLEFKDFSDTEREKLSKKGQAMPGGGFPIRNESDLHNAVQAVGRASNPDAAKSWIKKRARELDLTDQLPDSWQLSVRVEDVERAVLSLAAENLSDNSL